MSNKHARAERRVAKQAAQMAKEKVMQTHRLFLELGCQILPPEALQNLATVARELVKEAPGPAQFEVVFALVAAGYTANRATMVIDEFLIPPDETAGETKPKIPDWANRLLQILGLKVLDELLPTNKPAGPVRDEHELVQRAAASNILLAKDIRDI